MLDQAVFRLLGGCRCRSKNSFKSIANTNQIENSAYKRSMPPHNQMKSSKIIKPAIFTLLVLYFCHQQNGSTRLLRSYKYALFQNFSFPPLHLGGRLSGNTKICVVVLKNFYNRQIHGLPIKCTRLTFGFEKNLINVLRFLPANE